MAEQKEWKNLVLCVVVGFFLSPALFLELLYKNKQTNKQTKMELFASRYFVM